jgi:MFS family permease
LLSNSFAPEDRGRAIGSWSGLGTVFAAAGPFLGGLLVATGPHGWRWIFLVNVPVVAIALVLSRRGLPDVPGSRTQDSLRGQVDAAGAMLAVLGLGLLIAPLIEVSRLPLPAVVGLMAAGAATLVAFGLLERRRTVTGRPPAMLPVHLFAVRAFTVANVVTFAVYGALGAGSFLLTIALQVGLGYEPWAAGLATLPMTVIVAAFSPTVGSLVPRFGPRPFLALGPAVIATALIVLSRIAPGSNYVTGVLPGVLLFGVGLALVVAPVTTAAVAYVGQEHSGVASGVNNAVARIGTLVTVALIPVIGGLSRAGLDQSQALVDGYARAMASAAALTAAGAVAAWFGLPSGRPPEPAPDRPAS